MRGGNRGSFISLLTAAGILALGVGLVRDGAAVAEGVSRGLTMCGEILIPSLFPFMALSVFLAETEYGRILSLPLWPVTTRLFRLPGELGIVVLMSLVGGYPVGAKMIASLLEEGRIDRATAERMLCFSVNAGPSFVITAVGMGMLADRRTGVILFASQTAATVLIGFLVSRRAKPVGGGATERPTVGNGWALVRAVNSAASGMLSMCAFVVLCSGVLSLTNSLGVPERLAGLLSLDREAVGAVVAGLLEVTAGTAASSQLGGLAALLLTSCILSFGGCSVIFQVLSCFRETTIRFLPFLLSRAAHMGLAAGIALPLYLALGMSEPGSAPVWLAGTSPALYTAPGITPLSVCLLAMCTILILETAPSPEKK